MQSKPEGSNVSRYETFKQVEKTIGRTPTDLALAPTLDADLAYAWEAFCVLREHTFAEIEAYGRLTGVKLEPWEVEAVMALRRHREAGTQWQPKSEHSS